MVLLAGTLGGCGEPDPQFVHQDGTVPEIVWFNGPATELRMIQLEGADDDTTPVVWELSCAEPGCLESPLQVGHPPSGAREDIVAPNPLPPSTYDVTLVHVLEDNSEQRTNNSFVVEEALPLDAPTQPNPFEELLRALMLQG